MVKKERAPSFLWTTGNWLLDVIVKDLLMGRPVALEKVLRSSATLDTRVLSVVQLVMEMFVKQSVM